MGYSFHSSTAPQIQRLVSTILEAANQTSFDMSRSSSFKMTLETRTGSELVARFIPLDQGINPTTVKLDAYAMTIPAAGAMDLDGAYGTAVMVGSYIDVTVPTPVEGTAVAVPTTALLQAVATTEGGVTKQLNVQRMSNSVIRIYSRGSSAKWPTDCDNAPGAALVAGTGDYVFNDAVVAGNMFFVSEVSAGGGAADHFSAFRKNATTATLFAHNAAGALVATNTSTVRPFMFPASTKARSQAQVTLVAGVGDVTLANAVGDRLLVALESAGGTAANHYVAFRVNATTVRVHAVTAAGALQAASTSTVSVYNMGAIDVASDVLVAGTKDVLCSSSVGDFLFVRQITAGGAAANHFSCFRKNATEVTVFAQDNAGAKVAGNTSVVRVYNSLQLGEETSTVRWTVIRP